jgi:hypothetical protein
MRRVRAIAAGQVPCIQEGCSELATTEMQVRLSRAVVYHLPLCLEHSREPAEEVSDQLPRFGRPRLVDPAP